MNPRQRRGILLMIVAGIGALAITFTMVSYIGSLQAEMGSYRTVLQLNTDVPADEPLDESMFKETEVPAKFFQDSFVKQLSDLDLGSNQAPVAAAALDEGTLLQTSMVTSAPDLKSGEREVAVMVDAEAGVAGKLRPGSKVDVYGAVDPQQEDDQPCVVRALTEVEVIESGAARTGDDEEAQQANQLPVTFRLSPEETLELNYVESFSNSLRLALISSEGGGKPGTSEVCSDSLSDLGSSDDGQE
ncbi:pilus assembly protein CpaB [Haloactinospora alba]|uniref:Pilus assembly protein CpaB n=1 Tax=Haloactinospora alba TaxID=405555 RepID=A0A543NGF2_9ACTN|nr:RcpC/CpaB family pilus assembly protein [Haloactinospora alba]TQN30935.1 pilus assembly protein CpaB [Haloactinospora alba]